MLSSMLKEAAKGRARKRIALLLDGIEDDYQAGILRGASSAAQHAQIDLVCLAGGVISRPGQDERWLRNYLFELIDPADFDGILALGGSLSNGVGVAAFSEWIKRFSPLPIVSLGVELAGCHSIVVDAVPGIKDTLRHLIQVHNHRRIAFVRGPHTSFEAEERYAAYREVLAEAGISEDPRLVLQGNWMRDSGAAAVRELFDEHGMEVDAVRAIACCNDNMALGVLDALRERGISVPGEIAVTGFDDIEPSRCAVPPLTTVQQPIDALGRQGIKTLVSLMQGKDEPQLNRLPTTVANRRSCGCAKTEVLIHRRSSARAIRSLEAAVIERRAVIFAELARSARGGLIGAGPRWEERLLSALLADLSGREEGAFAAAVDQLMGGLQRAGSELSQVQPVLGTLRRALLDCTTGDAEASARIENALDAARELVAEWLVRGETLKRMEVVQLLRGLSRAAGMLLSTNGGASQRAALEQRLRGLGFTSLSLGLFTEPGGPSERCHCLAAFEPSGRARLDSFFRASQLFAPGVFDHERGALLVQPLVFETEPIGLLACPLGEHHGSVYEQMREMFAVGLRGYRLSHP